MTSRSRARYLCRVVSRNKPAYPAKEAAQANAALDTWRKRPVRPYECDWCGLWHLTSKP